MLHHHGERVPLLPSEIIALLDDSNKALPFRLPFVDERDIQDRNKTSGFAKFFSLVQGGWLVAQCIGRGVQHLPVSQLEIATVAFVACTFLASGFWWNKPLDVRMTTPIFYDGDLPDSFSCRNKGLVSREVLQRVKMTTRIIKRGSQKSMFFNIVLPFFCFSTIFSVIHLIAWNFDFATPTELRMWRACGLTATLAPIVIAGSLQLASIWDPGVKTTKEEKISAPEFAALVVLCYFMALAAYFVARMVLLFQVFYCLRSMPFEIYKNAAWINYIPHA